MKSRVPWLLPSNLDVAIMQITVMQVQITIYLARGQETYLQQ
jgi:hypothetical protein